MFYSFHVKFYVMVWVTFTQEKKGPEWPYKLLCEVANLKWEGPVDLHYFKEKQKMVKKLLASFALGNLLLSQFHLVTRLIDLSIFWIGEFASITISFGD